MINLTNIRIPDSVEDILSLGEGFSNSMINSKSKQMLEIIKDVEASIYKLPHSDQQDFRNKILHLSKDFVDKNNLHINIILKK